MLWEKINILQETNNLDYEDKSASYLTYKYLNKHTLVTLVDKTNSIDWMDIGGKLIAFASNKWNMMNSENTIYI